MRRDNWEHVNGIKKNKGKGAETLAIGIEGAPPEPDACDEAALLATVECLERGSQQADGRTECLEAGRKKSIVGQAFPPRNARCHRPTVLLAPAICARVLDRVCAPGSC